jgi:hypothetical protein
MGTDPLGETRVTHYIVFSLQLSLSYALSQFVLSLCLSHTLLPFLLRDFSSHTTTSTGAASCNTVQRLLRGGGGVEEGMVS